MFPEDDQKGIDNSFSKPKQTGAPAASVQQPPNKEAITNPYKSEDCDASVKRAFEASPKKRSAGHAEPEDGERSRSQEEDEYQASGHLPTNHLTHPTQASSPPVLEKHLPQTGAEVSPQAKGVRSDNVVQYDEACQCSDNASIKAPSPSVCASTAAPAVLQSIMSVAQQPPSLPQCRTYPRPGFAAHSARCLFNDDSDITIKVGSDQLQLLAEFHQVNFQCGITTVRRAFNSQLLEENDPMVWTDFDVLALLKSDEYKEAIAAQNPNLIVSIHEKELYDAKFLHAMALALLASVMGEKAGLSVTLALVGQSELGSSAHSIHEGFARPWYPTSPYGQHPDDCERHLFVHFNGAGGDAAHFSAITDEEESDDYMLSDFLAASLESSIATMGRSGSLPQQSLAKDVPHPTIPLWGMQRHKFYGQDEFADSLSGVVLPPGFTKFCVSTCPQQEGCLQALDGLLNDPSSPLRVIPTPINHGQSAYYALKEAVNGQLGLYGEDAFTEKDVFDILSSEAYSDAVGDQDRDFDPMDPAQESYRESLSDVELFSPIDLNYHQIALLARVMGEQCDISIKTIFLKANNPRSGYHSLVDLQVKTPRQGHPGLLFIHHNGAYQHESRFSAIARPINGLERQHLMDARLAMELAFGDQASQ